MRSSKMIWKKTAAFLTAMTMCIGAYGFKSIDNSYVPNVA